MPMKLATDNLGSIVGIQKGAQDGVKLMIAGHMDEVGFLVREIVEAIEAPPTPV